MFVMQVIEAFNKVKFTVAYPGALDGTSFLAIQLVDRLEYRQSKDIYANTIVQVGDLVLVAEVNQFLYGPNDLERDATEAVSHIIVGLIPPSNIHEIKDYSNLVKPRP